MEYVKVRVSDGEIIDRSKRSGAPDSPVKGYAWLLWQPGSVPEHDPRTHDVVRSVTLPDFSQSLAGKKAVETFSLSAKSGAEVDAILIKACKDLAYKKIVENIPFPEYLQRNLAGAGVRALKKIVIAGGTLTSEEQAKFAAGETLLGRVDDIRAFSNTLEASIQSADLADKTSVFDNATWPE